MTRANDKLTPCKDCRFRVRDKCRRDTPTGVLIKTLPPPIADTFPDGSPINGCFNGEPRVERSCLSCRKRAKEQCPLNGRVQYPFNVTPEWHCSDWEGCHG